MFFGWSHTFEPSLQPCPFPSRLNDALSICVNGGEVRDPEAQRRAAQGPLTLGPDSSPTWAASGDAFSLLAACFDLELEQQLVSAPDVERPHDGGSGAAEDGSFYHEGDGGP